MSVHDLLHFGIHRRESPLLHARFGSTHDRAQLFEFCPQSGKTDGCSQSGKSASGYNAAPETNLERYDARSDDRPQHARDHRMTRQPEKTWLYRLVHVGNLESLVRRNAVYSPNTTPADGTLYLTIHDRRVQASRSNHPIPCGPGGAVHDYVPFYLGPLSPMLLKLKSGQVEGYNEGQAPLIHLVTTAELVAEAGCRFVFSDGHGLATFTRWFDDLNDLDKVDWDVVNQRYWADTPDDNDRQRRKQAEFLVWNSLDWNLVKGIAVLNTSTKTQVENILAAHPTAHQPTVVLRPDWYY